MSELVRMWGPVDASTELHEMYTTNGQNTTGAPAGILVTPSYLPRIPGNPVCAESFGYQVMYAGVVAQEGVVRGSAVRIRAIAHNHLLLPLEIGRHGREPVHRGRLAVGGGYKYVLVCCALYAERDGHLAPLACGDGLTEVHELYVGVAVAVLLDGEQRVLVGRAVVDNHNLESRILLRQ